MNENLTIKGSLKLRCWKNKDGYDCRRNKGGYVKWKKYTMAKYTYFIMKRIV